MRKVVYKVIGADGKEFNTTKYSETIAEGCRLEEINLIPIDERTEKQKERVKEHIRKVEEKLREKRA